MMQLNQQIQGNGHLNKEAGDATRLSLPIDGQGNQYHNAQLDDYGDLRRGALPWRAGVRLELEAQFSHGVDELVGTAGFGFWNAPYGRGVALPQAVWFFFASEPNNLPLNKNGAGRGWFASTIDAGSWRAKRLIPLAPLALVGNQFGRIQNTIMPPIMNQLGISFQPLTVPITQRNRYALEWQKNGSCFYINDQIVFQTNHSPRGPLGFIAWIDNQYAIVTPRGNLRAGALKIPQTQWLEVGEIDIKPCGNT
ncbi:MAG: hypothetical protein ACPG8W_20565 [Candidatus Promineifilaceae bacterium]